jgi:hypothetical protein
MSRRNIHVAALVSLLPSCLDTRSLLRFSRKILRAPNGDPPLAGQGECTSDLLTVRLPPHNEAQTMDKPFFFERNLLALDREGSDLCERLSSAVTTKGRYRMLEARGALVVPSVVDGAGKAHPLHSLIDPEKEAERLVSGAAGFLLFLGLGGSASACHNRGGRVCWSGL